MLCWTPIVQIEIYNNATIIIGNSIQLYEVHEEGRLNKVKVSFVLMILHDISFIYNVHRNPDNKF